MSSHRNRNQFSLDALQAILDAIPDPVFVVDRNCVITACNEAATLLAHGKTQKLLRQRTGEALQCINATRTPEGCGHSDVCGDCVIRKAVAEAQAGRKTIRKRTTMLMVDDQDLETAVFMITAAPMPPQADDQNRVVLILEDISELVALQKIIPICMHCKKVRNDEEFWENVESYFQRFLEVEFSHGVCPDCLVKFYKS